MSHHQLKNKWAQYLRNEQKAAEHRKELLMTKGRPIFQKYGIAQAFLFGSVSIGRCNSRSDIDLLVRPLSPKAFWELLRDLEEALNMPIDLYTDSDDPVFVKKIMDRGEIIYFSESALPDAKSPS